MIFTRSELEASRRLIRQRHCPRASCACSFCVAVHALHVYGRMLDVIQAHENNPNRGFGDDEWVARIRKYLELA